MSRRVLFVTPYPMFGGPHNQALRLHEALRARGWEQLILISDAAGNAAGRLAPLGNVVLRTPLHRLRRTRNPLVHARLFAGSWTDLVRIWRLIRDRKIDVVIVTGLTNPQAALAARLADCAVVWQLLDSSAPRWLRVSLMPLVRKAAAVEMFNGDRLIPLYEGARPRRDHWLTYYPPVDVGRFGPSTAHSVDVRRMWGIPTDALVVGTVANWTPQKGIEYFVKSADRIARSRDDAWFLMVGATYETHRHYARQIRALVAGYAWAAERLVFAGPSDEPERYYPAMDVMLVTSIPQSEGTTTTIMEAMACGVPVVATDVGAVADVVSDGETGYLVPPLDAHAIAEAVLRLLSDANMRRAMAASAREAAVERFAVERCADVHVRAFEMALRRQGSDRREPRTSRS